MAIPAIIAYNYFVNRANRFAGDMEWTCEMLISGFSETRHKTAKAQEPERETAVANN